MERLFENSMLFGNNIFREFGIYTCVSNILIKWFILTIISEQGMLKSSDMYNILS